MTDQAANSKIDFLHSELHKTRRRLNMALAAVELVEWVAEIDYKCPWCGAYKSLHQGHKPDCLRQKVLGQE